MPPKKIYKVPTILNMLTRYCLEVAFAMRDRRLHYYVVSFNSSVDFCYLISWWFEAGEGRCVFVLCGWNGLARRGLKKLTKMEEKKEEAKRNENGVNEQRGFNTNILRFLKWTLNINRKQGGEERSGHVSMRWVQTSAAASPIPRGDSGELKRLMLLISCPFLWHRRPSGGSWWRSRGLARQTAWYRVFSPYRWSMAAFPRWPSSFWRPQRVVVHHRVSWGF